MVSIWSMFDQGLIDSIESISPWFDDTDPVPRRKTKATKTSGAAKVYWRQREALIISVLEWISLDHSWNPWISGSQLIPGSHFKSRHSCQPTKTKSRDTSVQKVGFVGQK